MENSYTNTVLQSISEKLNEGIQDVNSVSITIAAIVLIIIILPIIIRVRNRKIIRQKSEASFQKLIRKYNLTILELDLIDKLSESLKKPEERYQLLINKNSLRQAVKNSPPIDGIEEKILLSLKRKLGFSIPDVSAIAGSTMGLEQGLPAKLLNEDGTSADASIYSVSENNLAVKYDSTSAQIEADSRVTLLCINENRFTVFSLKPDRIKEEIFSAAHTKAVEITKINTRINIIAEKTHSGEEHSEQFALVIVHLSGHGAFIFDKTGVLVQGNKFKFRLDNDTEHDRTLYAEVLKISEEKKLASVKLISEELFTLDEPE